MSAVSEEIASQPEIWRRAARCAAEVSDRLPPRGARVAMIGCGTSYYVARAIAAMREAEGIGESDAFVASEVPDGRSYDVVAAISRSGTTTEVVRALEGLPVGSESLAICADGDTSVAELARRAVVLDFADERSVVQTRFATGVLALFRAAFGHGVEAMARAGERVLAEPLPRDPADFDHFVFLGRGWAAALADEAALKFREAAGAWTESYPAMEYRHGPISAADERTLVWTFGPVDPELLDDVRETGAAVVEGMLDPMVDLVMAQRAAVALAEARGLDPDRPHHLARSVVLE
jgi:fructoselysine-6-P-deglycase FrlB-like protein